MRINKPIVNYKDWKTKVIIGYVLIIALFCVATTWILFVTVPQAMEDMNRSESPVASQVEDDTAADTEGVLQGEDAEQLSASANSVVGGGTYTVQAEDAGSRSGKFACVDPGVWIRVAARGPLDRCIVELLEL